MKTQEKNKPTAKSQNIFKPSWNGVPATVRRTLFESSLYESVFASLFWHIAGALLIWGLTFALLFFGIAPKLFPKPQMKVKDIEFILKDTSGHRIHPPKIKATPSEVEKTAPSVEKSEASSQAPASTSQNANQGSNKSTTVRHNQAGKSGSAAHLSKGGIPDFSMAMPSMKSMSSGLGGTGRTKHHVSGVESSSSINDFGNSSSVGHGAGSRTGLDKTTTKKIITTYDISPYVNELKRNIRWNWKAPSNSKRVELFLRIAKDGRVVILNVKKTSEIGEVDNAALNAVRKSMPLNPLPSKYAKSFLDVVFTFDSTVGSRY